NEELIDAINTVKGRLIENKNLEITRKRKRNRRLSFLNQLHMLNFEATRRNILHPYGCKDPSCYVKEYQQRGFGKVGGR
ncbi:unnamed protein product, partial [marine sediment metagenome]